jgi:hypothetical protein
MYMVSPFRGGPPRFDPALSVVLVELPSAAGLMTVYRSGLALPSRRT